MFEIKTFNSFQTQVFLSSKLYCSIVRMFNIFDVYSDFFR